ncbi:MAG: diadenylate cyclase domain-containing protein, partial [Halobacteria archaeon]|nr:diadenylate cyclase domain-containing protein [Halobacteria archaeon]
MTVEEIVGDIADDASAVLVFSPDLSPDSLGDPPDDTEFITVASEGDVDLPLEFETFEQRVRFGVEGALENGFVESGETVVCVDEVFDQSLDTVARVKVTEEVRTGLYDLFMDSKAEPDVIRDVLTLSIELGKKGQKGKPIGALFVVGDAG